MSASTELEAVGLNMLIVSTILSGLTVLEYAWNVRFEIRVIWPQLWRSAEAKIFMIVRYVGLAGQIFNVWGFFSHNNRTHGGSTTDDSKLVLPRDALLPLTGRLVLGKARFLQESENDRQLTKVDLDNLEPLEDCDISSAKHSDSKVIPTKLTIVVDSELGVGAEEDIADVCICDWMDNASVSSYAPTIMSMETGSSGEGSGSRN
ncbi:hypothetical protein AZE42_07959 [Rhizopogon vesiculosus]|uniref:Uncharacterized protein n=1 Tax=Rhizopogon vesiculosus TaxID=180088 RepID=A0A1J8QSD9_9AGAM|nr:hypothetical protein AZE42_07959 [Rhizopogon vesiculosus]